MIRLATILLLLTSSLSFAIDSETHRRSTEEWSSLVWAAASDGNWKALEQLFDKVPEGSGEVLDSFRNELATYQTHRLEEETANEKALAESIYKMNDYANDDKIMLAMQSAIKAQTLSKDLNTVLYDENAQIVLRKAKVNIEANLNDGNLLVAQTLSFYLRTFYEDTDRRDLYEQWKKKHEEISIDVALLRYYAPIFHHELWTKLSELLGDDPPEPLQEKTKDLWEERVADISSIMVIHSLRKAESEHLAHITWLELLSGGLEAVQRLGALPELSETFPKLNEHLRCEQWQTAIDEEEEMLPHYIRHISGNKVLVQLLERLITANDQTLQLPVNVLLREFGDGAMGKLDRYSAIVWPNEKRQFDQATEGNFVGVGIVIRESKTGEILVVNPIDGSPAYYGGVVPEDIITHVNGTPTSGWTVNDAVEKITGKRGTAVTLTIKRETEEEPVDLVLRRDRIILRSVSGWNKKSISQEGDPIWDWYIDPINHIGYIKLTGFSKSTYADVLSAIRSMQEIAQPNGLILDLRHNPGGLLPTARQISNLFIKEGTIVSGENAKGDKLFDMKAHANRAYLSDWPVVVLINQGSASASEIVSGAVQAHNAGIIVGQRSWGKGSVQTVHNLGSDSLALVKLTTQFYRLPEVDGELGRLVHKREGSTDWGVVPDIEVRMSAEQITKSNTLRRDSQMLLYDSDNGELPDINDLLTKGLDPQLETALLLLRANALAEMDSEFRHARLK